MAPCRSFLHRPLLPAFVVAFAVVIPWLLACPVFADGPVLRSDAGDHWILFDPMEAVFDEEGGHPGPGAPAETLFCGGDVPCPCGGTAIDDVRLEADLTGCAGFGLIVGADSRVIDGNGHIIDGVGPGAGVYVPGRRDVEIRNCVIRGFRIGVQTLRAPRARIRDNRLTGNAVSAVWVKEGHGSTVEGNLVHDNGWIGIGQRIGAITTFQSTDDGAILGNEAESNGNVDAYVGGIVLYESSRNRIEGNTLVDTREDNIWVRLGSGENTIRDNRITGSSMDGIWIRESDGNRVEGNTLSDLRFYGVYVRSGRNTTVTGNRIERAGQDGYGGIGVGGLEYSSRWNVIRGNRVVDCTDGLVVHERARDNLFIDNVVEGAHVGVRGGDGYPGASNRIENTRIAGSAHRDVKLAGSHGRLDIVGSEFDSTALELQCFGGECRIDVRWLLDVLVLDPGGAPVPGASVVLRDVFGDPVHSALTDASGRVAAMEATAYVLRPEGRTDHNDHSLSVSKEGLGERTVDLLIDRNFETTVVLGGPAAATGVPEGAAGGVPELFVSPVPSGGAVTIRFSAGAREPVALAIYDARGRCVATPDGGSGGTVLWDRRTDGGRRAGSGTYFVRLAAASGSVTRKIVLTGN